MRRLSSKIFAGSHYFRQNNFPYKQPLKNLVIASTLLASSYGLYSRITKKDSNSLHPSSPTKRNVVRQRFEQFASQTFNGNSYMSPRDMLESLLHNSPRPRFTRKQIDAKTAEKSLISVPTKQNREGDMFSKMENKGLISFVEYAFIVFLLKHPNGLKVTFGMFDVDHDKNISREEFMELLNYDDLNSRTTILTHLFGYSQQDSLTFEDLETFSKELQLEVRKLEFNHFSKGMSTISAMEFASLIMSNHTQVPASQFLERLMANKIENEINLEEFCQFHSLITNMRKFEVAVSMHSLSGVNKEEFRRAATFATGREISENLVEVLFGMFDADVDDRLSYKEFFSIIKSPYSAFFSSGRSEGSYYQNWKYCVKNELKFAY